MELEGDLVVRVQAGRNDDVDVDLLGDALHPRQVAPQAEHRRVEDRVDAQPGQGRELGDRLGDLGVLVPVTLEILPVLLPQDEDVLVGQHAAQVGGVDAPGHGGYRRHG